MSIDHLEMAEHLLRDARHGDKPQTPEFSLAVISHVLIALVRSVDSVAASLAWKWWSTLSPEQRDAELKAERFIYEKEEEQE